MTPDLRRNTSLLCRTLLLLPLFGLGTASCLTPDAYHRGGQGGGATAGSDAAGTTGGGGATSASGGAGGTRATGGATGTGGILATGGVTGSGGLGTGGAIGTGGARATGGTTGSGATTGATLLNEDFESGTAQWITSGPGTATVKTDGSKVYDLADPMSKVFLAAAGDVAWTDVVVEARVKIVSWSGSSSSDYAGICARLADIDDYTCMTLRGDTKLAIREDVAGSGSSVGSSVTANLTTGTWYTVALTINGSSVTASLNGMPVLPKTGDSVAAPGSPAGGIALIVDNAEAEFDDVKVTVP